jgi:hypothetical protein
LEVNSRNNPIKAMTISNSITEYPLLSFFFCTIIPSVLEKEGCSLRLSSEESIPEGH